MRYLRGIVVMCLVFCANADAGQWRVVPGSNRQRDGKLRDGAADSTTSFMVTQEARGRGPDIEVMMIYDQQTRRVWWECNERESSAVTGQFYPWTVVRDQNGSALVGFLLVERLFAVKRSATNARSATEAETVVLDALPRTRESKCGIDGATAKIDLADFLKADFFYGAGTPLSEAKIKSVTSNKDGWVIELDGAVSPAGSPVRGGTGLPTIRTAVLRLSLDFQIVNVKSEVK